MRSHRPTVPVCDIIQTCKRLVKLECIPKASGEGRQSKDWYSQLASILQEHRDALRELRVGEPQISSHGVLFENNTDQPPIPYDRLHGLERMPCMTRLRIPWRILIGCKGLVSFIETLPPALEELSIELNDIPDEDLEAAFMELHQKCALGRFRAFRHIYLLWRFSSIPLTFPFDVAKIRTLYTAGHVQFDLTIYCKDVLSETLFTQ